MRCPTSILGLPKGMPSAARRLAPTGDCSISARTCCAGTCPSNTKLATLVPRPRHNLARYHGAFDRGCRQPNTKIRKLILPNPNKTNVKKVKGKGDDDTPNVTASENELVASLTWAQRLKSVIKILWQFGEQVV